MTGCYNGTYLFCPFLFQSITIPALLTVKLTTFHVAPTSQMPHKGACVAWGLTPLSEKPPSPQQPGALRADSPKQWELQKPESILIFLAPWSFPAPRQPLVEPDQESASHSDTKTVPKDGQVQQPLFLLLPFPRLTSDVEPQ